MENQSLDERAISLVHAECLNATDNGYLEPYYEMKRAALALARQLIELREARACRHKWEIHTSSEPVGAGLHVEAYKKCVKCGLVEES